MSRSRPFWIASLVAVLVLLGVGFLPLFGGPGYEAALAAGVLLPTVAACAVAVDFFGSPPVPADALGRGAAFGVALAGLGLAVVWLHGARVGYCDALEGTAFYALGPGFGAVLGAMWGALVALLVVQIGGSRRLAVLLAAAGPLGGIAISLYRFYTSPMVFAFDPFAGFFAGTLYDTVITGLRRLATYRIGSSLTIMAAFALAQNWYRRADGRLALRWRARPGVTILGIAAACGSLAITASGPALGHYQTTETIRERLGHAATSRRCEVVYPSGVLKRDAHALARECDAHVEQLEAYFDVSAPDRTTVFVFASPEQKGHLMGASRTYIAKPWRNEIYIQRSAFPHRVLRHELVHVVAGAFGEGPFQVSGPLNGWIPDPGRIEGLAVAAAPKEDDLTLMQWARAMRDLELLPGLGRVFKLSFLGEPSSRAYTVAGAFVEWFRERYGIEAVKGWYGGKRLASVADGKGLSALEREFKKALDEVTVSDEAMHVARARFDRPAIFGRRCPHVVDRLVREAGWALGTLDVDQARDRYLDALDLDPNNVTARLGLGTCALRDGNVDEAKELYARIASDEDLHEATRARAQEAIADVDLATQKLEAARKGYDGVAKVVVDEDHLRALDVKRYATDHDGREPVVAYLIGDLKLGRDASVGTAALGAWSVEDPELGLADYLLGRSFFASGRWRLAAAHLDSAFGRRLPLERVEREAWRTRLLIACGLGDRSAVGQAWEQLKKNGVSEARGAFLKEFVERCGAEDTQATKE